MTTNRGFWSMLACYAFFTTNAFAASENFNATATFDNGVTLGNEQNMDFDNVNYSGLPGAGDTVSLGTDGTIVYAGIFSGGGAGVPGSVDITAGNNGQVVEVFCDQTATLSDGAGGTIDAVSLEVVPEGAAGGFGAGQPCNGVLGGPAHSLVLNVGVLDTFIFGGQLDGTTAVGFSGGNLSTANPGGDNIQVDVFYQ